MADFSISIANSLNTFGPAPADTWGSKLWNAFLWGEGSEDLQVFINLIVATSALSLDTSISTLFEVYVTISNSLAPTADMFLEGLSDGSGYNYVFASNTTDGEGRTFPVYAPVSDGTGSWTEATAAVTTWS